MENSKELELCHGEIGTKSKFPGEFISALQPSLSFCFHHSLLVRNSFTLLHTFAFRGSPRIFRSAATD